MPISSECLAWDSSICTSRDGVFLGLRFSAPAAVNLRDRSDAGFDRPTAPSASHGGLSIDCSKRVAHECQMKWWELADKPVTQRGSHLSRFDVGVEHTGFSLSEPGRSCSTQVSRRVRQRSRDSRRQTGGPGAAPGPLPLRPSSGGRSRGRPSPYFVLKNAFSSLLPSAAVMTAR